MGFCRLPTAADWLQVPVSSLSSRLEMHVLSPARTNSSGDGESRAPLRRVAGPITIFRWEMYIALQYKPDGGLNTWQGESIPPVPGKSGRFNTDKGRGKGKGERDHSLYQDSLVHLDRVQRTGFDLGQTDYGDARSDITSINTHVM